MTAIPTPTQFPLHELAKTRYTFVLYFCLSFLEHLQSTDEN